MKKIEAIIEITRPLNLLITFMVVYVSAVICSGFFELSFNIILAGISAALTAASGNIINDYYDFDIDSINRPNRPLPSGRLSKKEALTLFYFLAIISLFLSYFISSAALLIVFCTIIILVLYSSYFKGFPLIGNIIVALCTGLAFIYGGVVVGNYKTALLPAIFAFLINLIREILKDIEDIDGDKINQILTFPIKFGLKSSNFLLTILVFILILTTVYPFITKFYKIEYFLIILFFVDLPLIYFLREIYSKEFLTKLSKLSLLLKTIMIFGLIAIFIGQI